MMQSHIRYSAIPEVEPIREESNNGSVCSSAHILRSSTIQSRERNSVVLNEAGTRKDTMNSSTQSHSPLEFFTPSGWKMSYHRFPADIVLAKIKAQKHKLKNPYRSTNISFSSDTDVLKEISPLYVNYFDFMNEAIKLVGILFVITGLLNFALLILIPECNPSLGELRDVWYKLSTLVEVQQRAPTWVKFALSGIAMVVIRFAAVKQDPLAIVESARAKITERDYAIFIENIPQGTSTKELTSFLNEELKDNEVIASVKGILHVDDIHTLLLEIKKLKKLQIQYLKNPLLREDLQVEITRLQEQITYLEEKCLSFDAPKTDKAIVLFDRTQARVTLLEKYQNSLKSSMWLSIKRYLFPRNQKALNKTLEFKSHHLLVKDCPLPADIIWENMNCSYSGKVKRKIVITLMSGIISAGLGALMHALQLFMNKVQIDFLNEVVYFITIVIFLHLSDLWSEYAIRFQKIEGKYLSQVFELLWKYWTRSIVIVLGFLTNFTSGEIDTYGYRLLCALLVFSFIAPLRKLTFISYGFVTRVINRRRYNHLEKANITQDEAERIFSNPEFDFVAGAMNVSNFFFMAFCFNTFMPLGSLLCLIGIVLSFYVDKYNIIYRHSVTKVSDPRLGINFYYLLRFDIPLQLLSNFVYWYVGTKNGESLGFFEIILIALFLFIAQTVIVSFYPNMAENPKFSTKNVSSQTYDSAKSKFKVTYLGCYPLATKNAF